MKKAPKKKVIRLKAKKKQRKIATALDVVSGILLEPTTFIKSPLAAGRKVKARREEISKTGDVSKAFDVVGETLTAATFFTGIGAAARAPRAALVAAKKAIPKTPLGKFAGLSAGGILATSKTARKFAEDPTKIGREAGLLIEKSGKGEKLPGVLDALKIGGLVGAAVVAGAGVKKGLEKIFTKTPDAAVNIPSQVPTSIALPPSPVPIVLASPIGLTGAPGAPGAPAVAEPVIAETPKPSETSPPGATEINVKVVNKPHINLAVAQSI